VRNDDDHPKRIGFDVVTIPDTGATFPLARSLANTTMPQQQQQQPHSLLFHGRYRTGRFNVDITALERIVVPAMNMFIPKEGEDEEGVFNADPSANSCTNNSHHTATNNTTVLVLDEIGKMELHSVRFRQAVQQLLLLQHPSLSLRVIGTVPTPGRVPFCDDLCRQHSAFVKVYDLNPRNNNNRDEIVNQVIRKIDSEWIVATK
jgi:nucleoside-triphosphatase THEP1